MKYKIANGNAEAIVSSLGGTVLSFKVDGKDILFPYYVNEKGKARGGCPICAPWFGKTDFGEKKHGFLRDIEADKFLPKGEDSIELLFTHEGVPGYPWGLEYRLIVSLGHRTLNMFLSVKRIDDGLFDPAPVNPAFHPYIASHGEKVSVTEGRNMYVDCFSKDAATVEFTDPLSVSVKNGKEKIMMGFGGSIDQRSRMVFWSDAVEKYVCVEPILTEKSLFNTSEGQRLNLGNPSLYLFMSLSVW